MRIVFASLLLVACSDRDFSQVTKDTATYTPTWEDTGDTDPEPEPAEPPVADAGADATALTGDTVVLDGTASHDPAGLEPLVYEWELITLPSGSAAKLSSTSSDTPRFTPDLDGTYTASLTVANTEGIWDPTPDTVTVHVTSEPILEPVADAGADQAVDVGYFVQLDGTASSDPQGLMPLTYLWAVAAKPNGASVSLSNPGASTPTFTADTEGTYTFELLVQNAGGVWDSTADTVDVVAVVPPVAPPIADAGPDDTADMGNIVVLDGSGSFDPAGLTPLTYAWSWVTRPAPSLAVLSSTSTPNPTFTADVDGTYELQLSVQNSGGVWSISPDRVVVTVDAPVPPGPPIADAGPDQTVDEDDVVVLDGSGSYDPAGYVPLAYSWTMVGKPNGSTAVLSSTLSPSPNFFADEDGAYTIELAVRNSAGVWSNIDTVVVDAIAAPVIPEPIANAGPNQVVDTGLQVQLDGTLSTDPTGLYPLTYQWTWVQRPSGSAAVLSCTSCSLPSFTADLDGTYELSLRVRNNAGIWDSTPDDVVVNATSPAPIQPPVPDAGPDQFVDAGDLVNLDGTASFDPGGLTPLSYVWTMVSRPSGSGASIGAANSSTPLFTADVDGQYVVELDVRNSAGLWSVSPDRVIITASTTVIREPVAVAGPDQTVTEGDPVYLDGSGSFDPDGYTPLAYVWTLVSRPGGSGATLFAPNTVNPSFTADVQGNYVLELAVRNSAGIWDSTPDTLIVHADAPVIGEPVANAGPDQQLTPLVTVDLDGTGSYDPAGLTPLAYQWTMLARPIGSTASLSDPTKPQPTFFADLAGDYVFDLTVRNSAGVWDSTPDRVTITANPADGFYVEVSWDADSDLDLHVLDGSTGLFGSGDVNFCNMTPNWGSQGSSLDDPSLDWDAIYGWGPETTTIAQPASGSYDIKVHFYGMDGQSSCGAFGCSASNARVNIYLGGQLAATYTRLMSDQGDLWNVGTIAWPSGQITTTNTLTWTGTTSCW